MAEGEDKQTTQNSNVVPFSRGTITIGQEPPQDEAPDIDEFFKRAQEAGFQEALLIGYSDEGIPGIITNLTSKQDIIYLAELAKQYVLSE